MLKWKLALQNVIFFIVLYFLWFKKKKFADWSEKDKKHLEQELSDVLIYLVRLSEKCHIDLPKAAIEKIALNGKKYPAEKVQGSSKKYTEYNWRVANFWKRLQTFQRLRDASDEIVVMVTKPRILWEQSLFFYGTCFYAGPNPMWIGNGSWKSGHSYYGHWLSQLVFTNKVIYNILQGSVNKGKYEYSHVLFSILLKCALLTRL